MIPRPIAPAEAEPRSSRSSPSPGAAQPQPADAELRLPRPPGVFRRWLSDHPRTVDWTIVAVYLLGCALMVAAELVSSYAADNFSDIEADVANEMRARGAYLLWPHVLIPVAVTAAVAALLAVRRRHPLLGVIIVSLLQVFELGFLALPNGIALVFLLYAVPVYRSIVAGWIAYGVALGTSVLFMALVAVIPWGGPVALVAYSGDRMAVSDVVILSVMTALWLLAALMLGINAGSRKRYVAALIDRAHQLAREREQRAELAAAAERSRIAREMHDIVAHSLSVVVTLAEGAAVALDADPAASRQAMQRASETGRSALVEMRRLLGVLRDPAAPGESTGPEPRGAAPLAPQPGVGQVRDLVAGFAEAGLSVELSEEGVPAGDAAQQLAVYRIVQEGLTNALRYAGPGAEVRVILEHTPERTTLEISDSGRSGALAGSERDRADGPIPGSGRGLAGVEQRVRIFGGVFEAGPHRGGWRLSTVIPARGAGREGGGS